MLDWIFHLLNHPWAPWSGSCVIVAWGAGHWLVLQYHAIIPIRRRLAVNILRLEQGQPLSLSLFDLPANPPVDDRALRPLLTLENLLGTGFEKRYQQDIPNLLLGMGLLFTLIGLAAALFFMTQELQTDHMDAARQALDGLLRSAALKFLSSISGLCTASLFSWAVKRQRAQLARQLAVLCQRLDERLAYPAEVSQTPLPCALPDPTRPPEPTPMAVMVEPPPLYQADGEKNMDKTPETRDTASEAQDETGAHAPPARTATAEPVMQDETATVASPAEVLPAMQASPERDTAPVAVIPPMPEAIPVADVAPVLAVRGPVFAQLAGEFLRARQQRRNQPPVKSVQQTK
ncbi:MAG: hypothetical protein HQL87_02850 [Magnetococcales bacterium]|nr:hypothetical protein [Magnetococcales bacterium]